MTNFLTKSAGPYVSRLRAHNIHPQPTCLFCFRYCGARTDATTIRVSSVLISHFLLDLQEADRRTTAGLSTNEPSQSFGPSAAGNQSIGFANALGSLGASIDPAHFRIDREDDVLDDTPDSEAVEGIELDLRAPFPTIADGNLKRVLNHEITHGGSRAGEEPS